ncbi:hypothetical protein C5167_044203, partial [Papaver somniferum]
KDDDNDSEDGDDDVLRPASWWDTVMEISKEIVQVRKRDEEEEEKRGKMATSPGSCPVKVQKNLVKYDVYVASCFKPNRKPSGSTGPKAEHFTKGVQDLLRKLALYICGKDIYVQKITDDQTRAAYYLARSGTSRPGDIISKDDFDENLKFIIKEDEDFEEAMKCRRADTVSLLHAGTGEGALVRLR